MAAPVQCNMRAHQFVHIFILFTQSITYPNSADLIFDSSYSHSAAVSLYLSKHSIAQWQFTRCRRGTHNLTEVLFLNFTISLVLFASVKQTFIYLIFLAVLFFNLIVRWCWRQCAQYLALGTIRIRGSHIWITLCACALLCLRWQIVQIVFEFLHNFRRNMWLIFSVKLLFESAINESNRYQFYVKW